MGLVFATFVADRALLLYRAVTKHYETPRARLPGEAGFREANRRIIRPDGERTTFGNTPAAKELARRFSVAMAEVRKEGFTKGDASAFSLSGHQFLTYCQLNSDSCVFLVHVPELRRFTDEAQNSLCDLSWIIAHALASDANLPPHARLAVGVKGVINYEAVLIGGLGGKDAPLDDIEHQERGFGLEKVHQLYPFFAADPDASP